MNDYPNPLLDGDSPLDGVESVVNILTFLEDQGDAIGDLQVHRPQYFPALSQKGLAGQLLLYALLRETLEYSIKRISPHIE